MSSILVSFTCKCWQKAQQSNFFPTLVIGSFRSGITSGLLYVTTADLDIAPSGFQTRRVIKPLLCSCSSPCRMGVLLRRWWQCPRWCRSSVLSKAKWRQICSVCWAVPSLY